jgi:hypothetical protein
LVNLTVCTIVRIDYFHYLHADNMTLHDILTGIGELKDVLENMTARLKNVEERVVRIEALLRKDNNQAVPTHAPSEHTPSAQALAQAILKELPQLRQELSTCAGTQQPYKAQNFIAAELPGNPDFGELHMEQNTSASNTAQSTAPTHSLASPPSGSIDYPSLQLRMSLGTYLLLMRFADG